MHFDSGTEGLPWSKDYFFGLSIRLFNKNYRRSGLCDFMLALKIIFLNLNWRDDCPVRR